MTSLVLRDTPLQHRRRFINDVAAIVGQGNIRAFYLPSETEGLTVPDAFVAGRVWTHAATPAGRLRKHGKGAALSFNGTSDYLSTPDAADLSFVEPATMSAFAVFNVTDTAANRSLITKYTTSNGEYIWQVRGTSDAGWFLAVDESAAITVSRATDAALTQGAWVTGGFSYSGAGGASAMDGVAIYQNGAAVASTPANSASYVAMENLAAGLLIGAMTAGAANFFPGLMAMVLLVAANLSAAQQAALHQRCREYGMVD